MYVPLQCYSVWFPSRAKRTTPPLRGSGLSSSGCGSPPAAPWEWWWLDRRGSSLASLGGSTWLRYQRRRRQKETHNEALLSGEHQQVTGWSWAEHPVTTHFRGQYQASVSGLETPEETNILFAYHKYYMKMPHCNLDTNHVILTLKTCLNPMCCRSAHVNYSFWFISSIELD